MNLTLNVPVRHNNIYLIYLSTFGHAGQKVYKFGKTYECMSRFRGYPRDSTILFFSRVKDCHHVETVISNVFKDNFKRRKDIGLEYYEGDPKVMIEYINQIIDHMNQRKENNKLEEMKVGYSRYLRFEIYDRDEIPINLSDILIDNYKKPELSVLNKPRLKNIKKCLDFKKGVPTAPDINEELYDKYINMYEKDDASLTEENLYSVEKYLYMKNWKIDKIDSDFFDKWYGKTYIIYNLKLLKYNEMQDGLISLMDSKKRSNNKKAKYIRDFIETLGFTMNNIGKNSILSKKAFDANREKCYKSSKIYTKEKSKTLFDVKISKFETNKAFMGFTNYLLQQYGLCLKTLQKSVRDKVTKKKINSNYYYIDYFEEIDKYL